MNVVHTIPPTGQFVAFWLHDGELFSSTLRIVDGVRYVYDEFEQEFLVDIVDNSFYDRALFIVQ